MFLKIYLFGNRIYSDRKLETIFQEFDNLSDAIAESNKHDYWVIYEKLSNNTYKCITERIYVEN